MNFEVFSKRSNSFKVREDDFGCYPKVFFGYEYVLTAGCRMCVCMCIYIYTHNFLNTISVYHRDIFNHEASISCRSEIFDSAFFLYENRVVRYPFLLLNNCRCHGTLVVGYSGVGPNKLALEVNGWSRCISY